MEALGRGRKPSSANGSLNSTGGSARGGSGGGGGGLGPSGGGGGPGGAVDIGALESVSAAGPDAFRTAVCCQVLAELASLGGPGFPWSRVLRRIHTELLRAIYSDYYAADDGTLAFQQVRREGSL